MNESEVLRENLQARGLQALGGWLAFLDETERKLLAKIEKLRQQQQAAPPKAEAPEVEAAETLPTPPPAPQEEAQDPWL